MEGSYDLIRFAHQIITTNRRAKKDKKCLIQVFINVEKYVHVIYIDNYCIDNTII